MHLPQLVGIVNLTPDSFSGDGRMGEAALLHAAAHAASGADMLDIGAESTRPVAVPVTPEEEWARLAPFLAAAPSAPWRTGVALAVDTRHSATAARALAAGVDVINDVSGLADPEMARLLAAHGCDVVVMHALTVPVDKAVTWPDGVDPIAEILQWKSDVTHRAAAAGIAPSRLIYDPGLGFGKTASQSLALALGAGALVASGGRWYVGHSRKSFLGMFETKLSRHCEEHSDAAIHLSSASGDGLPRRPEGLLAMTELARDALTLAFSAMLAGAGVQYLRVHEVAAHRALWEQLGA